MHVITFAAYSFFVLAWNYLRHRRHRRLQREEAKRKHKIWSKNWLSPHDRANNYIEFLNILVSSDIPAFKQRMRMEPWLFEVLLTKVTPLIQRENTQFRYSIPPVVRLSLTLRYLASGNDPTTLQDLYKVGYSSVNPIIIDTCKALIAVLKPKYLCRPKTPQEWQKIAAGFSRKFQYHGCIGAIDGKHIRIVRPIKSASLFFNYKKYYSVVLMAIVDYNYEFIFTHVGTEGSVSDGGVWQNTNFKHALDNEQIQLPGMTSVPECDLKVPYHFIGDDAFQMTPRLLKPYSGAGLHYEEDVFSYRLSRARMCVENSFGILASRFRVLHTAIHMKPSHVEVVVTTLCALHNFLRRHSGKNYIPRGDLDAEVGPNHDFRPGNWRQQHPAQLDNIPPTSIRNPSAAAKDLRNKLAQYYCNQGVVPWQETRVNRRVGRINEFGCRLLVDDD